jgi:hypothetical protein
VKTWVLVALLGAALVACSTSNGPDTAAPPAPIFDPELCETRPEITSLQAIPEYPVAFDVIDARCDKPATSVLLVNTSGSSIRVEAVGLIDPKVEVDSAASGDFELLVSADSLPREIDPNGSLPVMFDFRTEVRSLVATGSLLVVTSDGCQAFEVRGISPESGLVLFGPSPVDFGARRKDEVSDSVEMVFTPVLQGPADQVPNRTFMTAGTFPPDVFEVVASVQEVAMRDCEPLTAAIRMTAPSTTGVTDGSLFYEVLGGGYAGIGEVKLRGRVTE